MHEETLHKLASKVIATCKSLGLTLSTAESLTAGMISSTLAGVDGASAVLMGGVVSYDSGIKHKVLGVCTQVIEEDGVVSAPCAVQMAMGAKNVMETDLAISATGIAGPTGGTVQTPVGTVYIGISTSVQTKALRCHFEGDRKQVRMQTVAKALEMVLEAIQDR